MYNTTIEVDNRRKVLAKQAAQLWDKNCDTCDKLAAGNKTKANPICGACPVTTINAGIYREMQELVAVRREIKYGEDWRRIAPITEKREYGNV